MNHGYFGQTVISISKADGWHDSVETFPYLSTILDAVWEERKLVITYQKEKESVERIVNPLGLVAKGNTWYLIGEVGW